MNKRQMKKNRQLRLENERLREAQRVRLETGFALQSTNVRIDDLYEELCKLRRAEMTNARTINQLVDQHGQLNRDCYELLPETQRLRIEHTQLKNRMSILENNNEFIGWVVFVVAAWLLLITMVGMTLL